eukprot:15458237-Alexandrium_andersonii.AAC.1
MGIASPQCRPQAFQRLTRASVRQIANRRATVFRARPSPQQPAPPKASSDHWGIEPMIGGSGAQKPGCGNPPEAA